MTDPTSRRRPPGRYDEPARVAQRLVAVLLSVLFFATLAGIVLALYTRFGGDQLRGQVRSYDVVSDREVRVEIEVSKPAGAPAYCVVRARGRDGAEVGRDVAVPDEVGTQERTARTSFLLTTTARAVTGEVGACTSERITREDVAP